MSLLEGRCETCPYDFFILNREFFQKGPVSFERPAGLTAAMSIDKRLNQRGKATGHCFLGLFWRDPLLGLQKLKQSVIAREHIAAVGCSSRTPAFFREYSSGI